MIREGKAKQKNERVHQAKRRTRKKQEDKNIPKRTYAIVEHATNANNYRQAETTKEDKKTKRTTQN